MEQDTAADQPIACTLDGANLAAEGERWRRLAAGTAVERTELADGLRLTFDRTPAVEAELAELVATERRCCAFARWTLRPEGARVALDVTAEGEAIALLHRMFEPL